jgi:drug/metabolite transporter (DMT)-like permease
MNTTVMAHRSGPLLVLTFCLSQAFRDVYFANVFQGVDFFSIILLAFGLSTVIFGVLTAIRAPAEFAKLRDHRSTVVGMNVTTAVAWTCYFFGLTHLEPSIVNMVHSGMGPLTVVGLAALGIQRANGETVGPLAYGCYAGIALSLAGLWWVVLSGNSGLGLESLATSLLGLALLVVSGSSITISLLYSKRLHDHGIHAEAVTTARYLLIVLLAACAKVLGGRPSGIDGAGDLVTLSLAATVLIVVPSFALQAGVARTAPLTTNVIRSLGPVCIFALEQLDHRMTYSAPTLLCIVAYSVFVVGGNVAHGWRAGPPVNVVVRVSGAG